MAHENVVSLSCVRHALAEVHRTTCLQTCTCIFQSLLRNHDQKTFSPASTSQHDNSLAGVETRASVFDPQNGFIQRNNNMTHKFQKNVARNGHTTVSTFRWLRPCDSLTISSQKSLASADAQLKQAQHTWAWATRCHCRKRFPSLFSTTLPHLRGDFGVHVFGPLIRWMLRAFSAAHPAESLLRFQQSHR